MTGHDAAEAGTVRLHARFFGRVQGVGFRMTTEHIARSHAVTGYVRNLPDGSVELVAEGEREEVRRFLEAIRARFRDYIRDVETDWETAPPQHSDFRIAF